MLAAARQRAAERRHSEEHAFSMSVGNEAADNVTKGVGSGDDLVAGFAAAAQHGYRGAGAGDGRGHFGVSEVGGLNGGVTACPSWPMSAVVDSAARSPRVSGACAELGNANGSGDGTSCWASDVGGSQFNHGLSGRASTVTNTDDDEEDTKRRRRREDRNQQSQAFRAWLKRQRAAGAFERRNEVHCPGFPVLASSSSPRSACSVNTSSVAKDVYPASPKSADFHAALGGVADPCYGRSGCGLASSSSRTPLVDSTGAAPGCGQVSPRRMSMSTASTAASSAAAAAAAGSPPDIGGSGGAGLDDSMRSVVSIGDRIEGIRACLEARMGTQRFQKLYQSLAGDAALGAAGGVPDGSVPWSADSDALVPLVAQLVACENSYFS